MAVALGDNLTSCSKTLSWCYLTLRKLESKREGRLTELSTSILVALTWNPLCGAFNAVIKSCNNDNEIHWKKSFSNHIQDSQEKQPFMEDRTNVIFQIFVEQRCLCKSWRVGAHHFVCCSHLTYMRFFSCFDWQSWWRIS